jgi:hypothetical protein
MTIRIYIEPLHRANSRGPCYRARLGSPTGEIIIESSTQPFFHAARVLVARGIIGGTEVWDNVLPYARMRGDITALAKLTVEEGDGPPRYRRRQPFASGRVGSKTSESPKKVALAGLQNTPLANRCPRTVSSMAKLAMDSR